MQIYTNSTHTKNEGKHIQIKDFCQKKRGKKGVGGKGKIIIFWAPL